MKSNDEFNSKPLLFFSIDKIKTDSADKRIKIIFISTLNYIIKQIKHWFRYIPLLIALCVVLFSINILNIVMLSIVLFLLWKPNQDKKFWLFFLVYCFFCTIVKHFGKDIFSVDHFNIESVAMIGLTTIEEDISGYYRSVEMISLYTLCLITSLKYRTILDAISIKEFSKDYGTLDTQPMNDISPLTPHKARISEETNSEKSQAKINYRGFITLSIKYAKFFVDLNRNYMIWVYHIFFNMILVNEQKDLLSTILFTSETACIVLHLILFRRNSTKSHYLDLLDMVPQLYASNGLCRCKVLSIFPEVLNNQLFLESKQESPWCL